VALELRLPGYFDLANKLGETLSFNIPGYSEKYYGRLVGIGVQLTIGATSISGKTTATVDCVRDSTDNNNLCTEFELYQKGKK
jgi:hypothetical protein